MEGQGHRDVRTPSLWFVGSWVVGSSVIGIVCSVASALALSLSLTFAMVTFWVVLLLPHSVGVVSLISFWVVSGTDKFGKPKTSGSPKTTDSGVVGSLVVVSLFLLLLVPCVLFAWVVWPCRCHCL